MKLYITQRNRPNIIGGGWTFNKNLEQGLKGTVEFVDHLEQADVFLISGVTMTEKGEIDKAKELNIPIVFRVDNIPLPSRNKGMDVMSRMKTYAEQAEVVIYQSNWSKELCEDICGDGVVIYNGVDTDIFNKSVSPHGTDKVRYLYVQHSSNPNKRFEEAKYIFSKKCKELSMNAELWLAGRFDGAEYNYDFIRGEKVRNLGEIGTREEMANIYKQCDVLIYPSFADSCPNTVLEARACGLDIIGTNETGGTRELLNKELDISLGRMADEYYQIFSIVLQIKQTKINEQE